MPKPFPSLSARGGLTAAALLVGLTGCGVERTYPVRGRVVFADGAPVTNGRVVFAPVDAGGIRGATAAIEPDGRFQLSTHGIADGAYPGRYRVAVQARGGRDDLLPDYVPPKYESPETSGLGAVVEASHNDIVLTIQRPAKAAAAAGPPGRRPPPPQPPPPPRSRLPE